MRVSNLNLLLLIFICTKAINETLKQMATFTRYRSSRYEYLRVKPALVYHVVRIR